MSDLDGHELVARLAGRVRVDAEPAAAASIVQYCHGIPLALRIVGTILAYRPARSLSWLARRLAAEEHRLNELSFCGESVRELYSSAYRKVAQSEDLWGEQETYRLPPLMRLFAAELYARKQRPFWYRSPGTTARPAGGLTS